MKDSPQCHFCRESRDVQAFSEQHLLNGDVTTGLVPVGESITAEHNRFEVLLHYLQTGTLPWQVANVSASDQAAALRGTCRDEWLRMQDHLKASREETPFYFRLLQLLTEEEYAQLIGVISGTIPQEFRAVAMQCLTLLLDGKSERVRHNHYTRLSLMAGVLAESIGWQKRSTARSLFKVAVAAVPLHERHLLKKFLAARSRQVASPFRQDGTDTVAWRFVSTPGAVEAKLPESTRHGLSRELRQELGPGDHKEVRLLHPSVYSEKNREPAVPHDFGRQLRSAPIDELYPLLVQQAGLVLLHPYIVRFFENCGVKDAASDVLRSSALPRAAALLHFLATGHKDLYEFELGLIKTLLGLKPETPLLICSGLLTQEDIEESEALFQTVIGQWSVLKNTSIHGVRFSFIERPGVLRQEENGWRLNVERKSFDVLLDQIPWGISIIKLPWMQQAILTEW